MASISTVSIFSTAIVALALANPGMATTDVELNDSGVWVTRTNDNLVGRFNHEAKVLDGAVTAGSSSFDVLQQAGSVLVHDIQAGTISPVDVAGLAFSGAATVPPGSQVALGGKAVAILDPKSGSLWVVPADGAASFSAKTTKRVAKVDPGAVLAVGVDGTVHAAGKDQLVTVKTSERGVPGEKTTAALGVTDPAKAKLAMTAVGTDAIVLDRSDGRIRLADGSWVAVTDAKNVALQQPGPMADAVVLANTQALVSQPLDGSSARSLKAGASGAPAAPVYLAGCAYGAWAGSGQVARDCDGTKDDLVQSLKDLGASARLQYRVNRDVIVLNELSTGSVWLADQKYERFDNWKDVLPEEQKVDKQDVTPQISDDPLKDRDQPNRPPVAKDDKFGVRPGSTTILKVLDNDTDPDGDVLTADVTGAHPGFGTLQPIYGGAAVQIAVSKDAQGGTSFDYAADDGRGGKDQATVTLNVRPWDQNEPPAPVRDTAAVVEQGKSVQVHALDNWQDPDGDDLILLSASVPPNGDEVRSTPDGVVTFQDAGTTQGRKTVAITVSDGQGAPVDGTLSIDVRPTGPQPPVAKPDHITTTVGKPVTVEPLANDTDPTGDGLRLSGVEPSAPAGAEVVPDYDNGTFSFASDVAQVYYVVYQVAEGPSCALGLVRIDVLPDADSSAPPVAVRDTALLPAGGEALVDVLANDVDPSGGVLVVQSVQTKANSGVSVELVNHQILRIRETRALPDRLTLNYTVSNGTASATGEVVVMPVPAPAALRPPVAVDDEATVRAGDVVTIPVLANDTDPDNADLSLVPDLVETPDPADGLVFVAENTVRFQAGPQAKTVYATYEVTDPQGQKRAALITITIRPSSADVNAAPRPRELTARVLAGSTVRIPIPLDGIDPDGDSVTLLGLDKAPDKGRVAAFGQGWMEYEASRSATGRDSFTYAVEDRFGARAVATVQIGIAPAPKANQAPQAVDDMVTVRPGRTVSVAVMANDVDPDGDQIQLISNGLEADGVKPKVVLDRVVLNAPDKAGVYNIVYAIQDTFGAQNTGTLSVDVRKDAPLRNPIARDDALTLGDILGKTTVDVPVLENDEDPDGAATALQVSTTALNAKVLKNHRVRVTPTETPQVIPYTITDPDGLTATAFVRVPGRSSLRPTLKPGTGEVKVVSGKTLTVDLADYVVVAPGKTARLTEAAKVRALRGTTTIVNEGRLTFVSDPSYYGPAALTFEVTDGKNTEDAAGRKSVLTIAITVVPDKNVPPTFAGASLSVVPGEKATADLSKYAIDPNPDDAKKLRFSVTGKAREGLDVSVDGTDLTVKADDAVSEGTVATVALAVTDGETGPVEGAVTITVVASTRELAAANDDVIPEAAAGRATVVPVLENDSNPFPGKPLKVVGAQVETGAGSDAGTATVSGSDVVVTPAKDFVGTMVVRYTVEDATRNPNRRVDGRILLTVQGRPKAPLTPTVTEVRSHTVVLSWSPPANNGSVITGYKVSSPQGYSRDCPATTCTLDGLTNNVAYTFTVVAVNAVADSDPSPASAPATPDAKPDAPQPPSLVFGDKALTVNWKNASYSDRSAIESVTLEISPAPPSGAIQKVAVTGSSLVWDGLQNGVPYRVRIQAKNRALDPSDWGGYSASEIPAGVPGQPGAPTTAELDPVGTQAQMQVKWPAADPNGDVVSEYALTVLLGGSPVRTISAGTQTSQAVVVDASESAYTYTVTAKNKAGVSVASAQSVPRRGVLKPGAVTSLSAKPENNSAQLAFGAAARNGAKAEEVRYQYKVNGTWTDLRPDKLVVGLSNNSSYTIAVRAVSKVLGVDYVGPETNANEVAPFGPPGTPTAVVEQIDRHIRLRWAAPARNGRDIRIETNVDGAGFKAAAANGLYDYGNEYSTPHSIVVAAIDTEGGRTEASDSRTSAPRPATGATIGKTGSANGRPGCAGTACQYVTVTYTDAPDTTVDVHCQQNDGSGMSDWNSPAQITLHGTEGATTVTLACYQGHTGWPIRVVLGNVVTTNTINW